MPQYRCPSCHKLFEWPSSSCPHCGMKISLPKDKVKPLYCSNCGEELMDGKSFCPACGSDQSIKEVQEVAVVATPSNNSGSYGGSLASTIIGSIGLNIAYFSLIFVVVFGFMSITSFILGVISTIFGAVNFKKSGSAKAGMIMGIVTVIISIITMIVYTGLILLVVYLIKKYAQ